MDPDAYVDRLGVSPPAEPSLRTLRTLQRAHVRTIPFENLAIVGDPFGSFEGNAVTLSVPALAEKLLARERGGYCFELNGLFGVLLADLGFDADRIAARVLGADGEARPPANHHSHIVSLDRDYVVDVGLGTPQMRRPLPLDGTPVTDEAGITWRVVKSERADAEYLTQVRQPGEEFKDRYVFRTTPRELRYFEATNEYLATAPESPFTDGPSIALATDAGYKTLDRDEFSVTEDGETTDHSVDPEEWHDVLEREFGLRV